MSTSTLNGKPRKHLADQLDRLDGLIDALSAGLNQAVADATREGARAALREVLTELLTSPDLLPPARSVQPPAADSRLSFWTRVRATAGCAASAVAGAVASAVGTAGPALKRVAAAVPVPGTAVLVIALALLIGLLAGTIALVCPSWVGAALAALTSATSVGAAFAGATVGRVLATIRVWS